MDILEIERLFQSAETLHKVFDEIKEDFEKVDYYMGLMKNNITDNPEECKKAINTLTGVYMRLKTVSAIAESEKRNRELKAYSKIKIETVKDGGKFTSAVADREASKNVADYRRIRNIIQGYVDASKNGISSLQSILKYLTEEIKLNRGQR